jgi:hypothetical protein
MRNTKIVDFFFEKKFTGKMKYFWLMSEGWLGEPPGYRKSPLSNTWQPTPSTHRPLSVHSLDSARKVCTEASFSSILALSFPF